MKTYLYIPLDQAEDVLTWGRHIEPATPLEGIHAITDLKGTAYVVTGPQKIDQRIFDPSFIACRVVPDDTRPAAWAACASWPRWQHEDKPWAIATVELGGDGPLEPQPFVEPVPIDIERAPDTIDKWEVIPPVIDDADVLETSRQIARKTYESHQKSLRADLVSVGPHQPWAKTRAEWLLAAMVQKVGPWALARLSEYDVNYWYLAIGAEPAGTGAKRPRRCYKLDGLELCGHPYGTNCSKADCLKTGMLSQAELLVAQGFPTEPVKPGTLHYKKTGEPNEWRRTRMIDADELRKILHDRTLELLHKTSALADDNKVGEVNFTCGEANGLLWVIGQIAKLAEVP